MYHRRPMLDPQLERIGVGYARLPDGMLTAFENATRKGTTWPVAYPADKQTDVPLDYGAEPWHRRLCDHVAISTVR
jgi:hypothetical protein